jgi:hypothetical protein
MIVLQKITNNKTILCKMHLGLDFHIELDQAAIETISFLVNCLAFNEPANESPTRTWLMYMHLLKCIHPKEQTT